MELIRMTREIFHCYVKDSEGNIYDRPIGSIGKRELDKKRNDFLKRYITLILTTKIVSSTTKIYIGSSFPSVASVIANHNHSVSELEKINVKTAQAKLYYDEKKLEKYFTKDMLLKVIASSSCNLEDYEKRLNLAIADYTKKNKLLDNLALKIRRVEVREHLEEDEFNECMSIIKPYIKSHMHFIENNLDNKACDYLHYLMSTPYLEGENKERYEYLKQLLG